MVTCNNCGTEMEDLVLSYDALTPEISYEHEIKITVNGRANAPDYWLYICPKCGNVQARLAETEKLDDNDHV